MSKGKRNKERETTDYTDFTDYFFIMEAQILNSLKISRHKVGLRKHEAMCRGELDRMDRMLATAGSRIAQPGK